MSINQIIGALILTVCRGGIFTMMAWSVGFRVAVVILAIALAMTAMVAGGCFLLCS